MMRRECLELAPVSASGSILRRALTERLVQLQIDEQSAGDFALAVTEAFSNAVNHGRPSAEERILASLHFHREQCSVTLVYAGDPFPTHSPALPPQWATSGRGRYIMNTLSDHVEYEFAHGITQVRLVKHWNGGSGYSVGS